MFAPDVEARFKRIEDELRAAAELLRRFEKETEKRGALVDRWIDKLNTRVEAIHDSRIRLEATLQRYHRFLAKGSAN